MKKGTKKGKGLSHLELTELAFLCGTMALLIAVGVFITGSRDSSVARTATSESQLAAVFPCSWFGDCASGTSISYGLFASTESSTPGAPVTLGWQAYHNTGSQYTYDCSLDTAGKGCTISGYGAVGAHDMFGADAGGGLIYNPGGCLNPTNAVYQNCAVGSVTVYPTVTTTYTLCSEYYNAGAGLGQYFPCPTVTVVVATPPAAAPTTLTSFTATPASVTSGSGTTLAWTGTKGTNFSACDLAGGQWGSGTWFSALPGSIATNALTANTTYSMSCFDTTGTATGWRSTTVTVTASQSTPRSGDACSNIAGVQSAPPANGVANADGTCSCNTGFDLLNGACTPHVATCSNGLSITSYPSCTCPDPANQHISGSLCVANPPTTCSNGLDSSYAPGCDCAALGQEQSGSLCVDKGVITGPTANPTRVRKGNPTTITWSTTGMASCTLSGPSATGGIATLSALLSGSVQVTVNSQSTYTLSCPDKAGVVRSSPVTVTLIPDVIEQ